MLKVLDNIQPLTTREEESEATLLGRLVAETVERFSPKQRAFAKIKIAEVLFDIEYGYPTEQ